MLRPFSRLGRQSLCVSRCLPRPLPPTPVLANLARSSRPVSTTVPRRLSLTMSSATPPSDEFILLLSCVDRTGIVAAVTGLLASEGHNILDSQQFGDPSTNRFFMRVHFTAGSSTSVPSLKDKFAAVEGQFAMELNVFDAKVKPRVMVMVSKIGPSLSSSAPSR